jgi:hypothetical protein
MPRPKADWEICKPDPEGTREQTIMSPESEPANKPVALEVALNTPSMT